jgi:HMG box factor
MVMTIPFINKIKVLAKISPPFASSQTSTIKTTPQGRGAVVAVEGQDTEAVNAMLQFLKELLSKDSQYHIHVFEGPDVNLSQGSDESEDMGDATVQYLDTISAWHKISDEIIHFITALPSGSPLSLQSGSPEEISSGISPKSIMSKTAKLQISSPRSSPTVDTDATMKTTTTIASTSGKGEITTTKAPFPVALVPRYQLSTADAHACATPINDAYAPTDHWQWMASLWRGCVGPDITVYTRECEKEELDKYGGGMPVEVRLNDARTLIVRKAIDSRGEIEEKALRRVGFEVEEFLRK